MLTSIKDTFKSNSNESLTLVNWALGQPNNFGNDQNFVSVSYPNFKWGDWSGDTIGEVICQQEIKGNNGQVILRLKLKGHKCYVEKRFSTEKVYILSTAKNTVWRCHRIEATSQLYRLGALE